MDTVIIINLILITNFGYEYLVLNRSYEWNLN